MRVGELQDRLDEYDDDQEVIIDVGGRVIEPSPLEKANGEVSL